MGASHETAAIDTQLPPRVVVDLESLRVVAAGSAEESRLSATRLVGTAIAELFADDVASVIADHIAPAVTAGDVWSGELRLASHSDSGSNEPGPHEPTAVTVWVPHVHGTATPRHVTVLLGQSVSVTTTPGVPDPLTGLPTRLVLLDRLDVARRRSRRNNDLLATLFVDLDGLKGINDRLGHDEGDASLRRAAARIRSCLRDGDTVARFGGDEFVVLCESLDHEEQAERVAHRILHALSSDTKRPLSASIGISYDHGGNLDGLELISHADAAMYRAKSAGGGRYDVFDTEMQSRLAADRSLRSRLLETLERDDFNVAAQPLFALGDARVLGVELFIRMTDDGSTVAGDDVLRLAREQAVAIDEAMLRRATDLAAQWQRELGARAPRVHLNVSAQSLASSTFADQVVFEVRSKGLGQRALALEVDADDLTTIGSSEAATIDRLGASGCRIVLDGFGASGSSLDLFESLRPSMAKIAVTDSATGEAASESVVVAMLRASMSMGVTCAVKGIEDAALLDRLVRAGAFAGQGNALSAVGTLDDIRRNLLTGPSVGF